MQIQVPQTALLQTRHEPAESALLPLAFLEAQYLTPTARQSRPVRTLHMGASHPAPPGTRKRAGLAAMAPEARLVPPDDLRVCWDGPRTVWGRARLWDGYRTVWEWARLGDGPSAPSKAAAVAGDAPPADVSLLVLFCAEWDGPDKRRQGRRPIALSAGGPASREVQTVPGNPSLSHGVGLSATGPGTPSQQLTSSNVRSRGVRKVVQ